MDDSDHVFVHFLCPGNSKWSCLLLVAAGRSAHWPSVPAVCPVHDQPQRPPGEDPEHPLISAEHSQQLRASPSTSILRDFKSNIEKPSVSIPTNYSLYYRWLQCCFFLQLHFTVLYSNYTQVSVRKPQRHGSIKQTRGLTTSGMHFLLWNKVKKQKKGNANGCICSLLMQLLFRRSSIKILGRRSYSSRWRQQRVVFLTIVWMSSLFFFFFFFFTTDVTVKVTGLFFRPVKERQ